MFCLSLAWSACGGDSKNVNPDPDAAIIEPSDGVTWELISVGTRRIDLMDPAVINTERSVRVLAAAQVSECDTLAMPGIVWEPETKEVFVDVRAWHPLNTQCNTALYDVERPVLLRFPAEGQWSVKAGVPGRSTDGITVDVVAAPARECMQQAGDCEMDCDCVAGEACVGGSGITGPFTQCARPCELDRDCGGAGRCFAQGSVLYTCDAAEAECGDALPCPDGFTCKDTGACEPVFVLNQTARSTCSSDDDCTAPLHCVDPAGGVGERRCEVLCQTASGNWCQGAHVCGQASEDLAGLAQSDSVCVWLGE